MEEKHRILGGKVLLYRRENSGNWQCSTFMSGRMRRATTGEDDIPAAIRYAEGWYLGLKVKQHAGEIQGGKLFKVAADKFLPEYEALTKGERNPRYVKQHGDRLRVHLLPFFGDKPLPAITAQTVQDYRVHRMTSKKDPQTGEAKPPAHTTLHHEIVTLRHVLKTAHRYGWIRSVPDLSPPYRTSRKVKRRAWFSKAEYKTLYEATRERAAKPLKASHAWDTEQFHDFVLLMANTGLRPDEAMRLEFRDVEIVHDKSTQETILEISVRGKRGVGYCKSMPGAVEPFRRLQNRKRPSPTETNPKALALPKPTDRLFPTSHREIMNAVLAELGMKFDREGQRRTAYSLRHSYICFRLLEGADIYAIAKNCRTSVEIIEKYYASHIKDMVDAADVNVRRSWSNGQPTKRGANAKRSKAVKGPGYPGPRR